LAKIPLSFCPNKPISEAPESVLKDTSLYAQRKHNGHCLFLLHIQDDKVKVFSRRMEDRTNYLREIPPIEEALYNTQDGDFILGEFVFTNHDGLEIPKIASRVCTVQDADEAMIRYTKYSEEGTFSFIPFDILFAENEYCGNMDYRDRYPYLTQRDFTPPPMFPFVKDVIEGARKAGWEGFVLRVYGKKSHIGYTLDGKAHRHGSYKWKFTKTDDFAVDKVLKGKSGKHAKFYAKFHVCQYDEEGKYIDRGYVGCGKLTHDELAELTRDINSGSRKIPFVVEVEYQSIHDESDALEFGVIQRLRDDKQPTECIYENN
jgi:ATP-dependent DNA ligase